jgi:RimJ/RimL family protein N-acetyltransferase
MSIHYRFAHQSDSLLVFNWRNEESVRLSSRNQAITSFEDHDKWFANRISKIQTEPILIFSNENFDIGYTRLDLLDSSESKVEISLAVTSDYQSKGFGSMMLETTIEVARNLLKVSEIIATVREDNRKSLKLFFSLGFSIFETQVEFIQLRLSLLE